MPADPTRPHLPEASARWPADFLERARSGLKVAGVLVPLIKRHQELCVLLTRRSAALRMHAGQVSFPGGRMESADATVAETALRETHEEVGIHPERVEITGFLPPSPTVTGYAVTPVIGLIGADIEIQIDPGEVDAAFEVPLDFLMDSSNEMHSTREFNGVELPIVEFHHSGERIWGATATIIQQLRKVLIK